MKRRHKRETEESFAQLRPYEKCAGHGPEALTDAELLAVLLRTGSRGESSVELAQRILANGQPPGLPGLLHYSLPQLMQLRGVGRVKGIEMLCAAEISKRIWRSLINVREQTFDRPDRISGYYMESMRHLEQEELHLMLLNGRCMLLRDLTLVSIVLVHNHPSGDPEPSEDDVALTEQVQEGAKLLDLCLMDHLIIGDQTYYSFKERGLIQ